MPTKTILSLLLLFPLTALAECGFVQSGTTMTIVVGKSNSKCFSSEGFREAFKTSVAQALEEDRPPEAPPKKTFDERSPRGKKLWTIAERNYQATSPTGRYFGQK